MMLLFVVIFGPQLVMAQEETQIRPIICPPGSLVRNPNNCGSFYSCSSTGVATEMHCNPADLCFKEATGKCEWCNDVPECLLTTPFPTSPSEEEDFPCPEPGSNMPAFIIHPGDCGKFYFCRSDGTFGGVGHCASGLWFVTKEQKCNVPWADKCID